MKERGEKERERELQRSKKIVDVETSQCWKMLQDDQHNTDIGAIFRQADLFREAELQRLFSELKSLDKSRNCQF